MDGSMYDVAVLFSLHSALYRLSFRSPDHPAHRSSDGFGYLARNRLSVTGRLLLLGACVGGLLCFAKPSRVCAQTSVATLGPNVSDGSKPLKAVRNDEAIPRYLVEAIELRGHVETSEAYIFRLMGLEAGQLIGPKDDRVELARLRLLASGNFLSVDMSLRRGSAPGRVILVVRLEGVERFCSTTFTWGPAKPPSFWGDLMFPKPTFSAKGFFWGADLWPRPNQTSLGPRLRWGPG